MPALVLILVAATALTVAAACLVAVIDLRRRLRRLEQRMFAAEMELVTSRSPFAATAEIATDPLLSEAGAAAPITDAMDDDAPGLAREFRFRSHPRSRGRMERVASGLAIASLTLSVPLVRPAREVAIVWSLEALGLLMCGLRYERGWLRRGGLVVFALAFLQWLTIPAGPARLPGFLIGSPALAPTLVFAAVCALGAWLSHRTTSGVPGRLDAEDWCRAGLILAGVFAPALLVSRELSLSFGVPDPERGLAMVLTWIAAASLILALAPSDRTPILTGAAGAFLLIASALAVARAHEWSTVPPALAWPLLNPRFLAGLMIVGLYVAYARLAARFPVGGDAIRARLRALALTTAGVFLLWNLSAEVVVMTLDGLPRGELTRIRSFGLTGLWITLAGAAMLGGVRWREPRLRLAALVLLLLAAARALVIDLARLA
jgi:hypothetical protein